MRERTRTWRWRTLRNPWPGPERVPHPLAGRHGQLRESPHRAAMIVEAGGESTFAHYVRVDRSGARPLPPELLEAWLERGWLELVEPPPAAEPLPASPGVVLDPFTGAGTTTLVALRLGRSFVGTELNPAYADLARERIIADAPLLNAAAETVATPTGGQPQHAA